MTDDGKHRYQHIHRLIKGVTNWYMSSKFEPYQSLLPSTGEAVPLFGLRILAFYNDQGEMNFQLKLDQEVKVPMSSVIGILELAKSEMVLTNAIYAAKQRLKDKDESDDD